MDPNPDNLTPYELFVQSLEAQLTITDQDLHDHKNLLNPPRDATGFDPEYVCDLCDGLLVRGRFCQACDSKFCLFCVRTRERETGERKCPNTECPETENYSRVIPKMDDNLISME